MLRELKYKIFNNDNEIGTLSIKSNYYDIKESMNTITQIKDIKQDITILSHSDSLTLIKESVDNFNKDFYIGNVSTIVENVNEVCFNENKLERRRVLFNNNIFSNIYLIANLPEIFKKYNKGNKQLKLFVISSVSNEIYPTDIRFVEDNSNLIFKIVFPETSICSYDNETYELKEYNCLDKKIRYKLLT